MTHIILLFVFLCSPAFAASSVSESISAKPKACSFFTYVSAEKLLDGKVTGVESEEALPDGGRKWKCTFSAESGKGKVAFELSTNATGDTARTEFDNIRRANAKHGDLVEWPGIGDEAMAARTEGRTFQLVMVRKGSSTIFIKVNPINGSTLDDVKQVATLLVGKLK